MQADIARLCGPMGPSMLGTGDNQGLRQHRIESILNTEGMARERDPAYLAQIRARRAVLQAQAVLLRAQEPCLDAAGAADPSEAPDALWYCRSG